MSETTSQRKQRSGRSKQRPVGFGRDDVEAWGEQRLRPREASPEAVVRSAVFIPRPPRADDRCVTGAPYIWRSARPRQSPPAHAPAAHPSDYDLGSAAIISNLQHMMENQGVGDNQNAPVRAALPQRPVPPPDCRDQLLPELGPGDLDRLWQGAVPARGRDRRSRLRMNG